MKIKESSHTVSKIFFAWALLCMVSMTIALYFEYDFFKHQAQRMLEMQKDYQDYLYSLKQLMKKRIIAAATSNCYEGTEGECDILSLNRVNREPLYLRKAALGFGKAHNVERIVKPLYEGGSWDPNYSNAIRSCLQPKQKNKTAAYAQKMHFLGYDFTLSWPLNKSQFWISSHFGPRKKRFHYGVDLAALKGTPVFPAMEGTVIEVSYTPKGYGKSIVIDHTRCKTRYAHLDEIFVKVGQKVFPSKQIGCVGDTGLVQGKKDASHLHFEVIDLFGKRINPLYILE